MRPGRYTLIAAFAVSGAFAAERPVLLKDAPSRAIVENNCGGCHSLDYIRINAPFMNRQTWTAEVNKMINNYKAPIAPEDVGTIVEYLTTLKGAK